MKEPVVYILSNMEKGTLYIGVTSDLVKRIFQHHWEVTEGFLKQTKTHRLVYFGRYTEHQKEKTAKKTEACMVAGIDWE